MLCEICGVSDAIFSRDRVAIIRGSVRRSAASTSVWRLSIFFCCTLLYGRRGIATFGLVGTQIFAHVLSLTFIAKFTYLFFFIIANCLKLVCRWFGSRFSGCVSWSDIFRVRHLTGPALSVVRIDRQTDALRAYHNTPLPRPSNNDVAVWCIWCSGSVGGRINIVALHRTRLMLGWVTAFGRVIHLGV